MAIKVRIQNFQSLKDVAFEIKGMTTITGQNNSGKTAIMRALRGIWENTACASYLRKGEAYFSVTMEFEDGHSVTWEKGTEKPLGKGATVNRYIIDGTAYNDVGGGVPDALNTLKVKSIQAAGHTLWPQIATQFPDTQHSSQVFLLDKTGPVIAEAIADVEKVGTLNRALKESETERRSVGTELKTRRKDESEVARGLERFKGLDVVDSYVSGLESQQAKLEEDKKALLLHLLLRDRIRKVDAEVANLSPVLAVSIPDGQRVEALTKLREGLAVCSDLRGRFQKATEAVAFLQPVESIPVPGMDRVETLQKYPKALVTVVRLRDDLAQTVAEIARLEKSAGISLPAEPTEVRAAWQQLEDARALRQSVLKANTEVTRYSQVPSVVIPQSDSLAEAKAALDTVCILRQKIRDSDLEVAEVLKKLEVAESDFATATAEVEALKATMGNCPLCGGAFEGTEHAHG